MRSRAVGDVQDLFAGGVIALEAATPLDIDWNWIERLATLIDDVETLELVSPGSPVDGTWRIACVDSSYWEIVGPDGMIHIVRDRFDETRSD